MPRGGKGLFIFKSKGKGGRKESLNGLVEGGRKGGVVVEDSGRMESKTWVIRTYLTQTSKTSLKI